MSDPKDKKPVQPGTSGKAAPQESDSMRRLEKDADKMADAGRKEQERYDEDHGIFDKEDSPRHQRPPEPQAAFGLSEGYVYRNSGASPSVIVASSLINTCSDGPAVSLNGS